MRIGQQSSLFFALALTLTLAPSVVAQESGGFQRETPEVDSTQNQPVQPDGYPQPEMAPPQEVIPPQEGQAPPYGEPPQYQQTLQYQGQPPSQPYYGPPAQTQPGAGYFGAAQSYPYRYSGYGNPQYSQPSSPFAPSPYGQNPYAIRPRVATAPAGLVIPVTLQTSISTQVARNGDYVQASIDHNIPLQGLSYIPAGSVVSEQVNDAAAGRMMNRSGVLGISFTNLRLPDGMSVPIQAHILGDIGKYAQNSGGDVHGEGWGRKLGAFALRTGIGAGGGALFGTALGAIAGGSVGTGAWAGTAIGGGIGALDDVFLRKGRNVLLNAGTSMQVQLDAQIQIPQDEVQPQSGAI